MLGDACYRLGMTTESEKRPNIYMNLFFLLLMIIVGIILETVFESLTVIKTFLKRMIYISLHTYFIAFEIRLPHSVKLTDEHLRSLSLVSIQTRDVHFSVDPNGVAILDVFERNPFICWNTTI